MHKLFCCYAGDEISRYPNSIRIIAIKVIIEEVSHSLPGQAVQDCMACQHVSSGRNKTGDLFERKTGKGEVIGEDGVGSNHPMVPLRGWRRRYHVTAGAQAALTKPEVAPPGWTLDLAVGSSTNCIPSTILSGLVSAILTTTPTTPATLLSIHSFTHPSFPSLYALNAFNCLWAGNIVVP